MDVIDDVLLGNSNAVYFMSKSATSEDLSVEFGFDMIVGLAIR